jgi:hypothetical protein
MTFIYGFGFETPSQRARNEANGWDDEDSAALVIDADSSQEALEWGRTVAEAFFKWLCDDPAVSWLAGQYADYLETETQSRWTSEQRRSLVTVAVGQMPDPAMLSAHRSPELRRSEG